VETTCHHWTRHLDDPFGTSTTHTWRRDGDRARSCWRLHWPTRLSATRWRPMCTCISAPATHDFFFRIPLTRARERRSDRRTARDQQTDHTQRKQGGGEEYLGLVLFTGAACRMLISWRPDNHWVPRARAPPDSGHLAGGKRLCLPSVIVRGPTSRPVFFIRNHKGHMFASPDVGS
jgi:hypothetical protein